MDIAVAGADDACSDTPHLNRLAAPDLAPQVVISAMWALSNVTMADHKPARGDAEPLDRATYIEAMLTLFERSIRPPAQEY